MSRNCLSGVPMDWLLIFLLLLSDLSSADENTYVQDDTVVCAGGEARFNWKYKVKPSFVWTAWTYNGSKIASSESLTFEPEVISSDRFKSRLKLNSTDPFTFTMKNATNMDNGTYACFFHFNGGKTDYVMGRLEVKECVNDNTLVKEEDNKDSCVILSCRVDPSCTWTFPNGTTKVAKKIRFCSNKTNETIRCESKSDHVCTCAIYPVIFLGESKETTTLTGPIVGGIFGGLVIVLVAVVITLYMRRRCKKPLTTELPQHDDED